MILVTSMLHFGECRWAKDNGKLPAWNLLKHQ